MLKCSTSWKLSELELIFLTCSAELHFLSLTMQKWKAAKMVFESVIMNTFTKHKVPRCIKILPITDLESCILHLHIENTNVFCLFLFF